MMPDTAFNLFVFIVREKVHEIGAVTHPVEGTDAEMDPVLRSCVAKDLLVCRRFPLPSQFKGMTAEGYHSLHRVGRQLELFEVAFVAFNASQHPLVCVTAVVDGVVTIDAMDNEPALLLGKFQGHPKLGRGGMPDYLEAYATPDGLNVPQLLNDDHVEAIKTAFNAKHYVSCMKLLCSFIDTLAFLALGDTDKNFVQWLNAYADIPKLGITAAELWELRNSLVHMSNLDSRRVLGGRERRISFFVGPRGMAAMHDPELTYFNLSDLIGVVADACTKWLTDIRGDQEKFRLLVQRYDRVLGDARVGKM
jgi:hypothetical protein